MLNNNVKTHKNSAFIKTINIKSEISVIYLLNSYPREELKALGCLNIPRILEFPTEPLNQPRSLDVALTQHLYGRVVRESDYKAAAVAGPPVAIIPLFPAQSEV